MAQALAAAALALATLTQGCFVDSVPPRDGLDRLWEDRMLAGHYGRWVGGIQVPWPEPGEDTLASYPEGTALTKYRIEVKSQPGFLRGRWWIHGGLIGRAEAPGATIELFAKENVRSHWPQQTAKLGRDYSQDYFLVLRPPGPGPGRLIKAWRFPPASLALVVDPAVEADFRRRYPEQEARKFIEQNRSHRVRGSLHLDLTADAATVTITGLTRPFAETVDLSRELRSKP
jgi:hypothetical protein